MDEQEKKYQDLFTELTNYERSGVRMLNRGPTLTTPHLPTIRRSRVPCRERS